MVHKFRFEQPSLSSVSKASGSETCPATDGHEVGLESAVGYFQIIRFWTATYTEIGTGA